LTPSIAWFFLLTQRLFCSDRCRKKEEWQLTDLCTWSLSLRSPLTFSQVSLPLQIKEQLDRSLQEDENGTPFSLLLLRTLFHTWLLLMCWWGRKRGMRAVYIVVIGWHDCEDGCDRLKRRRSKLGEEERLRFFLVVGKARDRRAPRRFSVLRRLRDRGRGQVPRRARRFRPQAVSWLPVSIFQRSRQMMVTCWVITGVDGQWHFVRFFTLLFDEVWHWRH
jgi:hypothetical protein